MELMELTFTNSMGQCVEVNMDSFEGGEENHSMHINDSLVGWAEEYTMTEEDRQTLEGIRSRFIETTRELEDYLKVRAKAWDQIRDEDGRWN